MEEKRIYCKGCRNGCLLKITVKNRTILQVEGNGCRRGISNAQKQLELTALGPAPDAAKK